MSIKKTLLMLTLNYILIFAWMFLYKAGLFSALVIFPASMLIAFFDTLLSTGKKSALIWCGNLLIANIAGILLQAYIYVRGTGDMDTAVLRCALEISVAILIIGITSAVSGHAAWKRERKRRALSTAANVQELPEERGDRDFHRFDASLQRPSFGEEEDTYEDEDIEDDDIEEEEDSGFRVIKKS